VYFLGPHHRPTAEHLLVHLFDDATTAKAYPIHIDLHANWWIFAAKNDWILDDNRSSVTETFFEHVPYWKKGPACIHTPVIVTAFAEKVITISPDGIELISADSDEVGEVETYCKSKYSGLRVVAFFFNDQEWTEESLKESAER
jgi:hypothetical protein